MNKLPEIITERLLLTELKAEDIKDIVEYASNKNISDSTLNLPHPYSEKEYPPDQQHISLAKLLP